LEEDDLIDYTPEIKAAALVLAKKCRMGPYFIPASALDGSTPQECSWYAPGASGGVNIDGGSAADPDSGLLYVASQSGLSTTEIVKDPCSEHRYVQGPHNTCGSPGAMPPPPGYVAPARGAGGGGGRGGGGAGGGRGAGGGPPTPVSYKDATPGTSAIAGISILKPRELGGITAYNMNSGDKAWWIPNGSRMIPATVNQNSPDAALFANVKLPMIPARGQQGQVMNTKTLVVYGTGRSGAPAEDGTNKLFAVDKSTGKLLGSVTIPGNTSAPPMTFMHQGKQYIVFATGVNANTALVALALPGK
jgi:quinoprotein glucose dehydrogenase